MVGLDESYAATLVVVVKETVREESVQDGEHADVVR